MHKLHSAIGVSLLWILLVSTLPLHSQTNEWKAYSNGLSVIRDIAEEGDYLWIATHGGAIRFHKHSYESIIYNKANSGLPSQFLVSIAVDNKGNKWMGTNRGLAQFDNNKWTVFTPNNSPLHSPIVQPMIANSKGIWVGATEELQHYDGTHWETIPVAMQNASISTLSSNKAGNILMGYQCNTGGILNCDNIYSYDQTTLSSISLAPYEFFTISAILQYNNTTWVAGSSRQQSTPDNLSYHNFLISNSGSGWENHDIRVFDSIWSNAMAIDSNGALWIGTQTNRIFQYQQNKWQAHTLDLKEHERITTVFTDSDGIVWCGTNAYKLFRFADNRWTTLFPTIEQFPRLPSPSPDITPKPLQVIAVDTDQSIWLGYTENMDTTITHISSHQWKNYSVPVNTSLLAIDSKGQKWLAAHKKSGSVQGGLWRMEHNTWQKVSDDNFHSIYIDRNDNIWLGTDNGVVKYDHTTWTEYTSNNSTIVGSAYAMAQDRAGTMWVVTKEGLSSFDGTTWERYDNIPLLRYSEPQMLTCDSTDVLWLGIKGVPPLTTDGLVSFDGQTAMFYTSDNSALPHTTINALTTDKHGTIWIASNGGLSKIQGTEWTTFTPDNSPLPTGSSISCLAVDGYNNLWIGTNTGSSNLFTYREGGVQVDVEEYPAPQRETPYLQQNMPNPVATHTTFRYSVPETTVPQHVRLQLFNALGVHVATLADDYKTAGAYTAEFDASTLPSGTYYYQLSIDNTTRTKQMLVVR